MLEHYTGREPFAQFARAYFRERPRHGATDRKMIASLCYGFFRIGNAMPAAPRSERIIAGLFLCSGSPNPMLEALQPSWNKDAARSIDEKAAIADVDLASVFPWRKELSSGIDPEAFCRSFFVQPDVFIRVRPGYESQVRQELTTAVIPFRECANGCLAMPNATKLDTVLQLDEEAVIQDLNSQRVGELFSLVMNTGERLIKVWDCCAGSGGKSILAADAFVNISLTVSDNRKIILTELEQRFNRAGISGYRAFEADLRRPPAAVAGEMFDLVILDAPCTGSGTWSRTPEQLNFFDETKIAHYRALQQAIAGNVIPHLAPGGYLLYITCSVFAGENEEVVDFIRENHHLQLVKSVVLEGYNDRADSLFAAILTAS